MNDEVFAEQPVVPRPSLLLAGTLGFLAGLRSMTPPAIIAWMAATHRMQLPQPLTILASKRVSWAFRLAAPFELTGDKLAFAPNRTEAPGVLARLTTGGLSGACIYAVRGGRPAVGALVGGVGGVAGTLAGFQARRWLTRRVAEREDGSLRTVPRLLVAIAEDIIAIAGSFALLHIACRRPFEIREGQDNAQERNADS